jgi:acetyl-CoA acetyltransferase
MQAVALVATAIRLGRHGVLAMVGRMGDGRHERAPMRVAHHATGHAMHRRHRENQPRQPCHRPKGWHACDMARRAVHRHSIKSVPASLNSGGGSIGLVTGTRHGSSVAPANYLL